jgi:hypothetical protein
LNVSPKFMCWKLNPQSDSIEVGTSRGEGHEAHPYEWINGEIMKSVSYCGCGFLIKG